MRLWTLHPKYLDSLGLVAAWREGLLARRVLMNETDGYKKHPQLIRFRKIKDSVPAIDKYLSSIFEEALKRGFNFDGSKFGKSEFNGKIPVKRGQIEYEFAHLKSKLKKRCLDKAKKIENTSERQINPVFCEVEGGIEDWEIVKN